MAKTIRVQFWPLTTIVEKQCKVKEIMQTSTICKILHEVDVILGYTQDAQSLMSAAMHTASQKKTDRPQKIY